MNLPLRNSFILKSFAIFIIMLLAAVSCITAAQAWRQWQSAKAALHQRGTVIADLLEANARLSILDDVPAHLENSLAGVMRQRDVESVAVGDLSGSPLIVACRGSAGDVIYTYHRPRNAGLKNNIDASRPLQIMEDNENIIFTRAIMSERTNSNELQMLFDQPALRNKTTFEVIGYIRLLMSKNSLKREMSAIIWRNIAMSLLPFIVVVLIAYISLRRISQPLRVLTESVYAFGRTGVYKAPLITKNDEIGTLTRSLAEMYTGLKRKDKEREALLQDLHDGLNGTVTILKMLVQRAIISESDRLGMLRHMDDLASEGVFEVRTMMQSLDEKNNNWDVLLSEINLYASKRLEPHEIAFSLITDVPNDEPISSILYVSIIKIVREAITNIIKHSGAAGATVIVTALPNKVRLEIADNGTGINKATPGRGLLGMKKRIMELGGQLDINSSEGARLILTVPLPITLRETL